MHAKKTQLADVGELLFVKENRITLQARTVAVKTDDLSDVGGKLSRICHKSPAGIEKEAVSHEITTCS